MRAEDLPFPRGQTASTGLSSVSADVLKNLEGREYYVNDEPPDGSPETGAGTGQARTGRQVRLKLCRNTSTFNLLPKKAVRLNVSGTGGNPTSSSDGHTNTTAQQVLGVVDEYLPSAGVAPNDLFYLVVEGPALMLTPVAAGSANISVGSAVVALTAASSGATEAGRIALQSLAGATSLLGDQIQHRIGTAMTAKTTAQTDADILVDVSILW